MFIRITVCSWDMTTNSKCRLDSTVDLSCCRFVIADVKSPGRSWSEQNEPVSCSSLCDPRLGLMVRTRHVDYFGLWGGKTPHPKFQNWILTKGSKSRGLYEEVLQLVVAELQLARWLNWQFSCESA
ncbi:hypothetical protein R1flu_026820 [Riccia fluitans]|uniref:Uncharacterized protein n=1 Tax=Riccia fluitans TaxID=41844 RepID=A0ABD1XH18_9MARC